VISLDLSKEESEILVDVLTSDLSDIRMEIADTDSMDFREQLKRRKAVIEKVLTGLRAGS
jgi:hypothetical protein